MVDMVHMFLKNQSIVRLASDLPGERSEHKSQSVGLSPTHVNHLAQKLEKCSMVAVTLLFRQLGVSYQIRGPACPSAILGATMKKKSSNPIFTSETRRTSN